MTIFEKAKKRNKDSNFNVIMPTSVAGIRGTSFYSFEIKEERRVIFMISIKS
jgi:hypothetical protein